MTDYIYLFFNQNTAKLINFHQNTVTKFKISQEKIRLILNRQQRAIKRGLFYADGSIIQCIGNRSSFFDKKTACLRAGGTVGK
jgi:hypothetical protein